MAKNLKVVKSQAAGRWVGRGADNVRTPGRYDVVQGERVVGRILADDRQAWGSSTRWDLLWTDKSLDPGLRSVRVFYSFSGAKKFVVSL